MELNSPLKTYDNTFQALPWEDEEVNSSLNSIHQFVLAKYDQQKSSITSPSLNSFIQRHQAIFLFLNNKLENTLPDSISESDTYELIEKQLSNNMQSITHCKWPADGVKSTKTQAIAQIVHHVNAFNYLKKQKGSLTPELLKDVHRILMIDSIADSGKPHLVGKFRETQVQSGTGFMFAESKDVVFMVKKSIKEFYCHIKKGRTFVIPAIGKLFYDLLVIHPFENGNGRLARLVASHLLVCHHICPFYPVFSSGHRKARSHYTHCLRHADKHHHTTRITTFILLSIWATWNNYDCLESLKSTPE